MPRIHIEVPEDTLRDLNDLVKDLDLNKSAFLRTVIQSAIAARRSVEEDASLLRASIKRAEAQREAR